MITIYLLIVVASALYCFFKYIFTHWQRKGFPYIKPSFPFGNLGLTARRMTSFGVNLYELYKSSTEPIVGIYLFFQPALLARDAELVKNILVTDFDSFHDRGVYHNPDDHFSENLFSLPGQKWRNLRMKLTPSFTSGKLKEMLPNIISTGEKLQTYLKPFADKGELAPMKELSNRYATDILASAVFGLDTNTLENPDDPFRIIEKRLNTSTLSDRIRSSAVFLFPKLLETLGISPMSKDIKDFMVDIVKKNIEYREKNQVSRKDFIQCLIELREAGKINEDDDLWSTETETTEFKSMSIEQCAAQVFLFYVAGFDSSASLVSFCLYELASNQELMKRLQCDIDKALERHNGTLTYECMQDIPLLELCVKESVRKYPTLPILNRISTKDYKIPNSSLTIEKGTPIIISLMGILRDPEYFPEPERFLPERFKDGENKYNPTAYIPFGDGPRACIALRLGKIVSKIALILLLHKYNFDCLDKEELKFNNYSVSLTVEGGINLRITNRNDIATNK